MTILKTTALCSLALAAMLIPEQADAHAFLLLPKTEFITPNKNLYAYWIQGSSVPPANSYNTGNAERNSEGFKKNYKTGNYKTLKDFIFKNQVVTGPYKDRPSGGTAECGFSVPTAAAQPLPDKLEYGNYNLQNREGIHPGPCEAWCDDEIVLPFVEDCRTILFKPITYAKDKCVGKKRLTFYWVATHFPPFQVYTSCVAIAGGGARTESATTTSTTPKAATGATPAANTGNNNNNNNKNTNTGNNNNNNKNTNAGSNNNKNDKVGGEADVPTASNSTVKCKVRRN